MGEAAINTAIKTTMLTASGIGQVHAYVRWAKRWADVLDMFKTGDHINGWTLSRTQTSSRRDQ